MKALNEFAFQPAAWLPSRDVEMLERVRDIKFEDMEYTNENGFSVKIVPDPDLNFVMHMFRKIEESDRLDKPYVMICPNQHPAAYISVAEMLNTFNVSARNVHAFAMDEWADQDGNVAPLTFGGGLGYSFMNHFYMRIREDLRPPIEQWHTFNNDNVNDYSKLIEEAGNGGADCCYTATGWPGHTAFIDPGTKEFAASSMEEFLTLGSRIVTETPLTICENSLFAPQGNSGDVWAIPPRSATIGPRDVYNARERFEMHKITFEGGACSWQRMISRIELYGPISMECPASICRLKPGVCYVSHDIARPITYWYNQIEDRHIF